MHRRLQDPSIWAVDCGRRKQIRILASWSLHILHRDLGFRSFRSRIQEADVQIAGGGRATRLARLCPQLKAPKVRARFTAAEGAGGHCKTLGRSTFNARTFDWLDSTLASTSAGAP